MADDPEKTDEAPPPTSAPTPASVKIIFCVVGVIAILIGLAMVRENRMLSNRYGTAVPSRFTGSALIGIGIAAIVTVFRRDLRHRKP